MILVYNLFMGGQKMESFEERDMREKSGTGEKTTLFYRPFNKKEHLEEKERIKNEEDLQKLRERQMEVELERSLDDDVIKQRFIEVASKLGSVKIQTEVDVSQERHILTFDGVTKNAKPVHDIARFVKGVKEGSENLGGVDAHMKLEWICGREEPLFLDFTVSIGTLLRGGGSLESQLKKLITEQFGGSYSYYRGMMERQKEKGTQEPETFKEEKKKVLDNIAALGFQAAVVENGGLFSVSITPGSQNRQIIVSSVDKQTWSVAVKVDQRIIKDIVNLQPQEILSAIERET